MWGRCRLRKHSICMTLATVLLTPKLRTQQERPQCVRVPQFGNYGVSPKPGARNEPSFQAWKLPLSTIACTCGYLETWFISQLGNCWETP